MTEKDYADWLMACIKASETDGKKMVEFYPSELIPIIQCLYEMATK